MNQRNSDSKCVCVCVYSQMFACLSARLCVCVWVLFLFVCVCLNMCLKDITEILGFVWIISAQPIWPNSQFNEVASVSECVCECVCECVVYMWTVLKTSRRCNLVSGNGVGEQPQRLTSILSQPCLNNHLSEMVLLWRALTVSVRIVLFCVQIRIYLFNVI